MFRIILLIFLTFIFWSCTSCSENKPQNDQVPVDNDLNSQTDTESPELDEDNDEDTDDNIDSATDSDSSADIENDSETADVDMYCPYPYKANYPYYREDKTIHFCRPCDTPDEYDPQCVKSLWKDLNKEVYDIFMAGGFEDNDWIQECYPWPCEWNVTSRTAECDTGIEPRSWAHSFNGYYKRSNMDNGKIMFYTYNYRIYASESISPESGYQGQRAVIYDIETGKYTVIGRATMPAYINNHIIVDPYYLDNSNISKKVLVDVVPYKGTYKYSVMFTDEDMSVGLDTAPFITEKWTVMDVNHYDGEDIDDSTRSLMYSETGKWEWTTLAKGMTDGKAGGISVSGDNALFYHYGTNATWLCDLSKKPQKIEDCKKVGREGELAGSPQFDRDNPNRVIYRSMVEGGGSSPNKYVILDISKVPWKIEKEFTIPMTETSGLAIYLEQVRSNVLLYAEKYVMDASGYQEDGKLCFYRLDTEKTYCSKLIGDSTKYGHGHSSFEGKYLFWQPMNGWGYILRDMECYCEKEGVCPYEGMDGFPSVGIGN